MRNNPKLDLIAEAYMDSVAPQAVVVDVQSQEGGCVDAAQGCHCGGCPECSNVESGQREEHDPTEIKMALAELRKAKEYAGKLEEMLQSAHGLEGWTAAKITKASDYLSSVYHWLEFETEAGDCHDSQFNMGYEDGGINQFEDGE
jgi:hypothetical protein